MTNITKGAIAAAVAAVLLLSGAGTLAYWEDSDDVTGTDFDAGSLSLTPLNACNVWNLDTGEPGGSPFDPLTEMIVPGDVITKVCTFTVDAVGTHLRATVAAVPGTNSGDLLEDLTVAAIDLAIDGAPITEITEANDADVLSVTVQVTFDSSADNTTQTLAAVLDTIAIETQQVHA